MGWYDVGPNNYEGGNYVLVSSTGTSSYSNIEFCHPGLGCLGFGTGTAYEVAESLNICTNLSENECNSTWGCLWWIR